MVGGWKSLGAAMIVPLGMARGASSQAIPTSFDQLRVLVKPGYLGHQHLLPVLFREAS